jgi:hypothetical protein
MEFTEKQKELLNDFKNNLAEQTMVNMSVEEAIMFAVNDYISRMA